MARATRNYGFGRRTPPRRRPIVKRWGAGGRGVAGGRYYRGAYRSMKRIGFRR